MNLADQYISAFNYLEELQPRELHRHIEKLRGFESFLPLGMTFMFITNASTQSYLYFTDNVENCTGLTKNQLMDTGVQGVMERVHPEDLPYWTEAINQLLNELMQLPAHDRLKSNMQFNYRFKHANGNYVNIVDNFIPIELTEEGIPFLFFGQVNITGHGEALPVRASLSVLNEQNNYELIKNINVRQAMVANGLTRREKEILELMLNGYSSKAIADKLFISIHTAYTHRRNINSKLKDRIVDNF